MKLLSRLSLGGFALLFCLSLATPSQGQTFFETYFTHKSYRFTGLLIYYDDNDMIMRVKYTRGEKGYTVSEFPLKGEIFTTNDGTQGHFLDGLPGKRVYPDVAPGFEPYNFILLKDEEGKPSTVYVVDEKSWAQSNNSDNLQEVAYWKEINPTETFTPDYVFNFFDKNEELYNVMLSYNPSNHLAGQEDRQQADQPSMPTDDKWSVVVSKGTGFGEEIIHNDHEWPANWIQDKLSEGYRLTKATFGASNYVVVMAKGTDIRKQVFTSSANWPSDWIEGQRRKGMQISELVHGNGKWTVVMSSDTEFTNQKTFRAAHFPLRDISRWKVKGYYITSVSYGGDEWGVVMSEGPEYPSQIWNVGEEFPTDWINSKWGQGYAVTDLMYGDNEWIAIMSKGTPFTQEFLSETAFPQTFLSEQWNLGYRITDFVYSGDGGIYSGNLSNSTPVATNYDGNPKLHLIMVANTRVSDIGASCENDKNKVVREFENISEALGIPLEQHLVVGDEYGKSSLTTTFNELKPGSNDIVVFVYTGHGFRWENQQSEYPMIDLTYSQYQRVEENTSMSLEEIYQRLSAKGARLTMVLGDCCNSSVGRTSRSGSASLASRPNERSRLDRLRSLFMETSGQVIAAAAQPNETACGNAQSGGYFINSFFGALHKETSYLYEENPSWDAIFSRTMESAAYKTDRLSGCTPQHGIFKMSK